MQRNWSGARVLRLSAWLQIYCVTVNWVALVAVPPGVVIAIFPITAGGRSLRLRSGPDLSLTA